MALLIGTFIPSAFVGIVIGYAAESIMAGFLSFIFVWVLMVITAVSI